DRRCRDLLQTRIAARCRRRGVRDRSRLSDSPGPQFQAHGQTYFCDVAAALSLRARRLEREHRDRSVLDFVGNFRTAWARDFEVEVKIALLESKRRSFGSRLERNGRGALAER